MPVIGFILGLIAAIWVAKDAKMRGMSSLGWGIGTFLVLVVFLPLYLLIRKPLQPEPARSLPPHPDTRICPICFNHYKGRHASCPTCGMPQNII